MSYRCITYHQLLLSFSVPDVVALAWATHDLGIWTAGTPDYLVPSADLAANYAGEFGIDDIDQLRAMVTEHHRLLPVEDRVTETFRQADLIDVVMVCCARGSGDRRFGRPLTRCCTKAFTPFWPKG